MTVHHCHIRRIYQLHLVTYYPPFLKIQKFFCGAYIGISNNLCSTVDKLVSVLRLYLTNVSVVFKLNNYTSTSDLQPSTAIATQLPDQLVITQIRTIGCSFKFIIALTVPSMKLV